MRREVLERLDASDAVIMAAAVADWRAEEVPEHKVKKGDADRWTITLVKNPDIAAEVGAAQEKRPGAGCLCRGDRAFEGTRHRKAQEKTSRPRGGQRREPDRDRLRG